MRTVNLYRAQGIAGEGVEPVTINIQYELPYADSNEEAHARFISEGSALAEALFEALPGGTLDTLITALLSRRHSLLRVPAPRGRAS